MTAFRRLCFRAVCRAQQISKIQQRSTPLLTMLMRTVNTSALSVLHRAYSAKRVCSKVRKQSASLALKNMGKEAQAIDISPLSVAVMKERGVDARQVNFYDPDFNERYDTILMLMNGTGIIGNLDNIDRFFARLKDLLNSDGCVLIDSSDLRYLFEEEDGSLMIDLADDYYGQLDYQMQYKDVVGEPFDWLYLDFNTLAYYAEENGFKAELVAEGEHYDYLARLIPA